MNLRDPIPPLSWRRYEMANPTRGLRAWTARRIAAAKRVVSREQDAVALFPHLSRYASVSDRQREVENDEAELRRRMRTFQAAQWRKCRRELRALPTITRLGFVTVWNRGIYPCSPSYLLDLLTSWKRGGPGGWAILREQRWLCLNGRKICRA